MGYRLTTTTQLEVPAAIAAVRAALAAQGFGVLTEIDMAATLRAKLGVEIAPQVILGACNPPFAHQSLQLEESIGLLLPCNVVVRRDGARTVVEAMDPLAMVTITGNEALRPVATQAAERLSAALGTLPA